MQSLSRQHIVVGLCVLGFIEMYETKRCAVWKIVKCSTTIEILKNPVGSTFNSNVHAFVRTQPILRRYFSCRFIFCLFSITKLKMEVDLRP